MMEAVGQRFDNFLKVAKSENHQTFYRAVFITFITATIINIPNVMAFNIIRHVS